MTFDGEKAYTQTKKVLGLIAVVATSLIVALDLIHNELVEKKDETEKNDS